MLIIQRIAVALCTVGVTILVPFANSCAQALDEPMAEPSTPVAIGVESDLSSRYLWRGMTCSDGAVSQNSLWVSQYGLTGSIWMNYDLDAEAGTPSLDEIDLSLSWAGSLGSWDFESAVQTYSYPRQAEYPWTAEVSIAITWNVPLIQPFCVHTVDIKEYSGAYFGEVGLRSGCPLRENLALDAQVSVGWGSAEFNEAYLGGAVAALNVAMFDAGITWNPTGALYLRPHVAMAAILDRDIRDLVDDPSPVLAGLVVGGEF